jgi:hypothetical protein
MKYAMSLRALCLVALSALALAQTDASGAFDDRTSKFIGMVQDLPTSELDPKLPSIRFADWLLAEGGPDAKIEWSYTSGYMGLCWNNTAYPHCACDAVDADVRTWDGREFFVQIRIGGVCSVPVFDTGMMAVSKKEGAAFMHHLSDLPRLRWSNPRKTRLTEG